MIENGPILWGACSISAGIAVFFVKIWINRLSRDIEKMDAKLENKLDKILCGERMLANRDNCNLLNNQNADDHKDFYSRLRDIELQIRGDKK